MSPAVGEGAPELRRTAEVRDRTGVKLLNPPAVVRAAGPERIETSLPLMATRRGMPSSWEQQPASPTSETLTFPLARRFWW